MAGLKVKASTLIEVIVALMILVLITTLASAFIINNYKKTNTSYRIQAFLLLDNVLEQTIKEKSYVPEVFETSTFKIRKQVIRDADRRLVTVNFSIEDRNDNLILERRRIFMIDDTITNLTYGQNESIYYH